MPAVCCDSLFSVLNQLQCALQRVMLQVLTPVGSTIQHVQLLESLHCSAAQLGGTACRA
jgi:hypothetical protein